MKLFLEPEAPVFQIYVSRLPHEVTLEQDFLQWRQEIKNMPEVTDLRIELDATLGDLRANRVHHKIVNSFNFLIFFVLNVNDKNKCLDIENEEFTNRSCLCRFILRVEHLIVLLYGHFTTKHVINLHFIGTTISLINLLHWPMQSFKVSRLFGSRGRWF
jgi:hypothetical protein